MPRFSSVMELLEAVRRLDAQYDQAYASYKLASDEADRAWSTPPERPSVLDEVDLERERCYAELSEYPRFELVSAMATHRASMRMNRFRISGRYRERLLETALREAIRQQDEQALTTDESLLATQEELATSTLATQSPSHSMTR